MEITDFINILIEQNKSFIEQNKNYKDMLFFGITSIVTVLVIFLTANFFTMRKFREEEKEKIKLEVIHQLENDKLQSIKKSLSDDLNLLVNNKFDEINNTTTSLRQKIEGINSNMNSHNKELANHFNHIEGSIEELSADLHYTNKVYSNAFRYYIYAGHHYLNAGTRGSGHFDSILNKLEKAVEKNRTLSSWELSQFDEFVNKLPDKYETQCARIKSKILALSITD